MTMKSMLLGAAAGLATVGVAHAADLPMTKADAVEYVKVCTEFGEGFFYIPGTDTCLKFSGEVRANYRFNSRDGRDEDVTKFSSQGRLKIDARTATDYGTLRSFFQLNGGYENGDHTFEVDKAFIQFGGLVAGKAHTMFGLYDRDYANTIFSGYYGPGGDANLLAYTAEFGGGISATLSLEDGRDHRSSLTAGDGIASFDGLGYGGQSVPDIVGNLRIEQGWGLAQLSAAAHNSRFPAQVIDPDTDLPIAGYIPQDSEWGFAVAAGVGVKLPIAVEAHFAVEGTYAVGASKYLGLGNALLTVGSDAVFDLVAPYDVAQGDGWSITGEFGVSVTPDVSLTAFASYVNYTGGDTILVNEFDFQSFIIGANAWYTVTPGLKIGAEVAYQHDERDGGSNADADEIAGGVRIVRSF